MSNTLYHFAESLVNKNRRNNSWNIYARKKAKFFQTTLKYDFNLYFHMPHLMPRILQITSKVLSFSINVQVYVWNKHVYAFLDIPYSFVNLK